MKEFAGGKCLIAINGNLTPDCQLFVEDNSVEKPWEALNHGAQVWAGLKIINRLNELLEDEPWPVLIDNAESVNGLMNLEVNYQLILTYVIEPEPEEQKISELRKKSKILPFN